MRIYESEYPILIGGRVWWRLQDALHYSLVTKKQVLLFLYRNYSTIWDYSLIGSEGSARPVKDAFYNNKLMDIYRQLVAKDIDIIYNGRSFATTYELRNLLESMAGVPDMPMEQWIEYVGHGDDEAERKTLHKLLNIAWDNLKRLEQENEDYWNTKD